MGNAAVLKPAEEACLVCLELGQLRLKRISARRAEHRDRTRRGRRGGADAPSWHQLRFVYRIARSGAACAGSRCVAHRTASAARHVDCRRSACQEGTRQGAGVVSAEVNLSTHAAGRCPIHRAGNVERPHRRRAGGRHSAEAVAFGSCAVSKGRLVADRRRSGVLAAVVAAVLAADGRPAGCSMARSLGGRRIEK